MMTNQDSHHTTSSTDQSLASSSLWQQQLDYYQRLGIHAWHGRVPYKITNTWSLAQHYANISAQYLISYFNQYPEHKKANIIELGTGLGQFSHRYMTCLIHALQHHPSIIRRLNLILCDASDKVLNYLRHHPQLQQLPAIDYVKLCVLPNHISPWPNHISLQSGACVIIANYFFDSLYQNAFYVEHNQVKLASINQESNNVPFHFSPSNHTGPFYRDRSLEAIIHQHKHLNIERFLIPEGTFNLLALLTQKTDSYCLLCSDKGHIDFTHESYDAYFNFCRDGPWSSNVNFFALDRYITTSLGGHGWMTHEPLPCYETNLCTGIWTNLKDHTHLIQKASEQLLSTHNSLDIHICTQRLLSTPPPDLQTLNSIWRLNAYEPELLNIFYDQLTPLSPAQLQHILPFDLMVKRISYTPFPSTQSLLKKYIHLADHAQHQQSLMQLKAMYRSWFGSLS
ncbi:MAG: SAM-dependent methyltransferase [Pseudomonadota bacterium]|nr:SAM-dependent methyltransferase [Pseudomonadota bacterium]